ncbi:hypothetical protein DW651_01795 [Subdoligranulum sp. AM23-21AC]|uniref:Uncharacterized protein n=1 Tax=Ruthenibacterium lactatiformans TaxID=1550024 RepID=A0A0W7TQL8_9FIRM|nr:hypothetical protein ASJ35_10095 [Ruthenibacterium lactatiformans]RGD22553.1 hypothetical protein DW651_01795 [Subdoligranulum sp. AM23-21AC]RJW34855.1 hypothetical protein DXC43_01345 [Subdoligranulum sp. TF05-17AC]
MLCGRCWPRAADSGKAAGSRICTNCGNPAPTCHSCGFAPARLTGRAFFSTLEYKKTGAAPKAPHP